LVPALIVVLLLMPEDTLMMVVMADPCLLFFGFREPALTRANARQNMLIS
jgi:hypothetical protein